MIALRTLVPNLADVPELQVDNLTIDSRQVTNGTLFIALKGTSNDGHDFIDAAVAKGAVAVFAQREVGDCRVPVVVINDLAARVSQIAGEFFGHPSRALQCVAVTGTNGKTSVAHFVAELASRIGANAGFLGTTGWGLVGSSEGLAAAALTTADAVELQQRLAHLRNDGCELVALELSSHALQQHRGDALHIDVGLFTNLTRDHLDYHGTMAAYGAAKARLFDFPSLTGSAVNACDEFGAEIVRRCIRNRVEGQTVLALVDEGCLSASETAAALRISKFTSSSNGMAWQLESPWGCAQVKTPLIGAYNAFNLSLAIAALALLDYDFNRVAALVPSISAPAGRLQRVGAPGDTAPHAAVFVDYAHTPDALASVLSAARAHCEGRLLCVFGCGGDRDKGKRAPMGQLVHRIADLGILTSDNPRFEDPLAIIKDVEAGLPAGHHLRVEPDRYAAIALALREAKPKDVVIIAGKGHEDYQDVRGVRLPFDDVAVARELLHRMTSAGDVI